MQRLRFERGPVVVAGTPGYRDMGFRSGQLDGTPNYEIIRSAHSVKSLPRIVFHPHTASNLPAGETHGGSYRAAQEPQR